VSNPKLLLVDAPTTYLDPAERVRFLNQLSELGEYNSAILSPHIVKVVSERCANMAIIDQGFNVLDITIIVIVFYHKS
jgi:ABC-2 type transport system ATP-binding protein